MRLIKVACSLLVLCICLLPSRVMAAVPTLNIGSASAVVGGQVTVPVTLTTNGAGIASLSMDIGFDPTKFSLPMNSAGTEPAAAVIGSAGAASSKSVYQSSHSAGVLRVAVTNTNALTIGDGVVFTVTLNVLAAVTPGTVTLIGTPVASSPAAVHVPITGAGGLITVQQPSAVSTLSIGSASAVAGGQVTVPVTLATNGAAISSLSMDIGFDPAIFALPGGVTPAAAVIGAAGSASSKSVIQSSPSSGVLRVGITDTSSAQTIGDGVVFTVTLNVLASAVPGTLTLTGAPVASSPAAVHVPITGTAGSVMVSSPPATVQTLSIGSGNAVAGGQVTVPVTLTGSGAGIASLSMDITFDPTRLSLPMNSAGTEPVAAVIGAAGAASSKSVYQSSHSAGVLRVAITNTNAFTIGDGVVFTVTFNVQAGATPGTVALTGTPVASSPAAVHVPITGAAGSVTVSLPPATVPTLSIGSGNAAAGGQVTVPVTLTGNGAGIASLSMDITFDPTRLSLPMNSAGTEPVAAVIGAASAASSKSVYQSSHSAGVLRVAVTNTNTLTIGDGVVFTVTFNVPAGVVFGTVTLTGTSVASSPAAVHVPISSAAGSITVSGSGSQSDIQKPVVTSFAIPATATSPTITVTTFTATDNTGVTGYLITESASVPAAGANGWMVGKPDSYTFTTVPDLVATTRTLYAWARDAAGNVSNLFTPADITVTLPDLTPPLISNLSMLTDGAFTNVPVQNITGTAVDVSSPPVTVTVNGVSTPVNSVTGTFNTSVTLANRANTVTITATDSAVTPNTATVVRNLTLDTAVPGFTGIVPADNSLTKNIVITVSGTIDDPAATVKVAVNSGTPVTAALTGTVFTCQVTLTAGVNTIDLTVTDPASNVTSAKRTVTSDPTAPTLAITSPSQDVSTAAATMTVGGTVSDNRDTIQTVTVSVDGQTVTPATAVTNGSFSQLLTLPTLKIYAVTVSSTDLAGNVATVQRNITRRLPNGAINGSAEPSLADALKVLNVSVGLTTLSAAEKVNADVAPLVNGKPVPDGTVDVGDALIILKRVIGLLTW